MDGFVAAKPNPNAGGAKWRNNHAAVSRLHIPGRL